ncbi:hypothetical protein OIU84_017676 [Salix udensis]|uniref:Uncharacterized protein n=1 Tax=Salix udensis TaxID=889485 RepID=A0AAD6PKT8_9ROSI|nr:hypothetical protein OIU84_017676 [Salix udensis]
MVLLCGYGESDHQFMVDEHDDGSFDQLFEKYRRETDDNEEAFTFMQKEIVKGLLWMRIHGAERESSRSRSTSPPGDGSSSAQFTNSSCGILPVIPKKKRSGGKRRKSESRALDLGFDFSDEIKALLGEDGDKDFKLRIKKKLFQTDTNPHHDRLTMPCRQINELENLLIGAEKKRICHGDGIGVTLVELGLGMWECSIEDDYVQIYSFRRNGELWLVLVKNSDHEEGRTDGVFGRRTGAAQAAE